MPGRKPLPSNIKELKGTARPCRMNTQEPEPPLVPEDVESSIELTGYAKKHFDKTLKLLEEAKITTYVDLDALAAYCEAVAVFVDATKRVKKDGIVLETRDGNPMKNPAVAIANQANTLMLKYQTEFGMTPSSRTKVNATGPKKKDENPFSKFGKKSA